MRKKTSMPGEDAIRAAAQSGSPFSNSGEGEAWMEGNCYRCRNDDGNGCPLLLVALTGATPAQWEPSRLANGGRWYTCTHFTPLKDGDHLDLPTAEDIWPEETPR
jgi:hypothetical protein